MTIDLEITALAAGGDGVGRDAQGRVTFVPRTAPGDRVRVRIGKETRSFARAEIEEVVTSSPQRVDPPCEFFKAGCGGCQWQHVTRAAQLEAKQAIVAGALRNLGNLEIERIVDPAPPFGWRRRARFHVFGGKVGLYAAASRRLIPISHCPQLEPALDAALAAIAPLTPPDGELVLLRGHRGQIVVGLERTWRGAAAIVGKAEITGVIAGGERHGDPVIEIEPDLWGSPWDFAQASTDGNRALIDLVRGALVSAHGADPSGSMTRGGTPRGALLELYAGSGNFTRVLAADGWWVTATDRVEPVKPARGVRFVAGPVERVVRKLAGPYDAIVLDPPRTGAAEAIDAILRFAPATIVYVSCDPATLARDAARLVAGGYDAVRAWPVDLMPQTSHIEVVLQLRKRAGAPATASP